MKKLTVIVIPFLVFTTLVTGFSKSNYDVTSNTYQDSSDWNQKCQNEFGPDATYGEWADLREGFNSLGQTEWRNWLDSFYGSKGSDAHMYYLGDKKASDSRWYFGSKHEGDLPGYYLDYDDIDDNWMSLGSWDGNRRIFCNLPNSPPNNPTGLTPSSDGVDTNPQISADFNDPDQDSGTLYFQTGGQSNIGSCPVSDGGSCSVTYSGANNWGTSYTFQVYAEDSSGATSGTTSQSFTTNYRPSVSNLRAAGSPPSLDPTLKADVSDSDGECLTVTFRDASDNSDIGSKSVCPGQSETRTVEVSTSGETIGSNPGTPYSFDVVVSEDDGQTSVTSGDQSFTTVHRPEITSLTASPTGKEVSDSADLQVDVTHPDNLDMNVEFFMDGSSIGDDTVTGGSGTARTIPSLGYSEVHDWNLTVYTEGYSTSVSGGGWSFETVHNTGLDSISGPLIDPAPLNPDLEAWVSHSDPSEKLTVEFVNDDNNNVICSQSGITDTESVTCDTLGSGFGSNKGTTYDWRVDLSGDQASESYSSSVQSFTTEQFLNVNADILTQNVNRDPKGSYIGSSKLKAKVYNNQGLAMDVNFLVRDGGTWKLIEQVQNVGNNSVVAADISDESFISRDSVYDWKAEVVDGSVLAKNSSTFSTHVLEVDVQPGSDVFDQVELYYRNQSSADLTDYRLLDTFETTSGIKVNASNRELDSSLGSNEACFKAVGLLYNLRGMPVEQCAGGEIS